MTDRMARRLAWPLFALTIALSALALLFLLLGRSEPQPAGSFGFRGFAIAFAITFGTIGAVVASRQPANPIGWIFCALGVGGGLQELTQQYAIYAILLKDPPLGGGEVAAWFPSWVWIPITGALIFVFLRFPDGRPLSPRWRWLELVGVVGIVVASLGNALQPGPLENFRPIHNPFAVGTRGAMQAAGNVGLALYFGAIAGGAVALVARYRRSRGDERQQLKWLAISAVFVAIALAPSFFATPAGGQLADWFENVVILSFTGVPIAIGLAILKYRLYDIDVVINKTVVYGALAAFITVVYVSIVVGVGAAIGSRGNAVLSAIAAAIVAIAFQPVRRRAQRVADRLVYGDRATPYEVLSEFSDRLAGSYSVEDVLPRMVRIISEGTGASETHVWLRVGPELRPAAAWPEAARAAASVPLSGDDLPTFHGDLRAFPVRHQGELLGAITVAMPANDRLSPAQEKLIGDLCSQAGLVLRNVRLIEELRASRQRLVAAQDEERRRLERDLHDGAQQQLVALAVKLRLAEGLAGRDMEREKEMLAELQTEATEALENLRDLARGIYPPLLADRGLPEAIAAQARKSPVPTIVEAEGVDRYPQEVEAAVYFCCLEALQNVAKYANAAKAAVRLAESNGFLAFEVRDDGIGFDPTARPPGSGLQNMADRLEAVGGKLEVRSAPGSGTVLVGSLPVDRSVVAG